jgi:predicted nucleic acid-binding protein
MSRPTLVVDASVAIKWILPEEGQGLAVCIQDLYEDEKLDLVAPYLLIAEAGNVLWKLVRRGDLTREAAERCFLQLLRDSPILLDSPAVSVSAFQLALAHARPFCDCLYLALALEQHCDLVTADAKFFNALRPAFPCLKLLEHFQAL